MVSDERSLRMKISPALRGLIVALVFSASLHAGLDRLPLVMPAAKAEWKGQSLDQEMAPGVMVEATYERAADGARIVVISAPIKEKADNALREFALGIRESLAGQGVRDVKEEKKTIAGVAGLAMTFTVRQGEQDLAAALFVFESGNRFFAYMSANAGPGLATLQELKKKGG
jgi:hypothetical protein